MAKIAAKNAIVLISGYALSTFATSWEVKQDAGKIDVTGMTEGSHNFIPGLPSVSGTVDMFWDKAADSVHAALSALPSNGALTIMPEGYTLGAPTISFPMMQSTYTPKGSPASAISVGQITWDSYGNNVGSENGWALAHGTITATTTGTGFDDPTSAAVTAACGGTLHIWTPTSTDTYVIKIQHSTTLGSGYADLITFAATGTTRTVERQTVASGTINRYRRIVATRTGSGDSFGFSVHFYHL